MEDSEENIHVDTGAETNLHATWVNFFLQSNWCLKDSLDTVICQ